MASPLHTSGLSFMAVKMNPILLMQWDRSSYCYLVSIGIVVKIYFSPGMKML